MITAKQDKSGFNFSRSCCSSYKKAQLHLIRFDEQQDLEKLNPLLSCLAVITCLPRHRLWYRTPDEQLLHLTYGIHT